MIEIKLMLDGEINMELDVDDLMHRDLHSVILQFIVENADLVLEQIRVEE